MAWQNNVKKIQSFIFGGETGNTYEDIQAQRALADKMQQRVAGSAPSTFGEGLSAIGSAIAYRRANNKASSGEKAGREDFNSNFNDLMGSYGSTQSSPGTPSYNPSQTGSNPYQANPGQSQQGSVDIKSGILQTAESLGVDPVDLATAISYETAGTFNPTKNGPTTQWGQHKGLIQFGGPQREKYGVDLSSAEAALSSQLGANGAVAKYLRDTGVKPGMGLLDIYSAINAGGVGRYNRSDANNGGAPGTVRDKVEKQMAGHRRKAAQLLGTDFSAPARPSTPYTPQQRAQNPRMAQQHQFDPRMIEMMSNPYATSGQKAFMQLMLQKQMQGSDPMRQMQLQKMELELQQMQNPQADPMQQVQLEKAQIELDQMRNPQADPMREIQLQKAQLELQEMQNPDRETVVVDGRLIDKSTGEVVYEAAPGQSDLNFKDEQALRKEFIGIPAVKAFSEQTQAYGRISASAKDPSPAGDLALIFNYMKMLDPGSVVRESEFATAANASAWLQQAEEGGTQIPRPIANAIRQMSTGQRLAPEQRTDFVGRSQMLYENANQNFQGLRNQYIGTAQAYGLDPDRALPSFTYSGEVYQPPVKPNPENPQTNQTGEPEYGSPEWALWYMQQNGGQ